MPITIRYVRKGGLITRTSRTLRLFVVAREAVQVFRALRRIAALFKNDLQPSTRRIRVIEVLMEMLKRQIEAIGLPPVDVVQALTKLVTEFKQQAPDDATAIRSLLLSMIEMKDNDERFKALRAYARETLERLFRELFPNGKPGVLDDVSVAAFINSRINWERMKKAM